MLFGGNHDAGILGGANDGFGVNGLSVCMFRRASRSRSRISESEPRAWPRGPWSTAMMLRSSDSFL